MPCHNMELASSLEDKRKVIINQSHIVGYSILNELLVLSLSLETISEVSLAASSCPPMMTRLLSWLTLQTLDPSLFSVRLRGSLTQSPFWTFHWMQLFGV